MADIAQRHANNPILKPADLPPSRPGMEVVCLLNPGTFKFDGKIWLIVRVAERGIPASGLHRYPVYDSLTGVKFIEIPQNHPDLNTTDARVHHFQGADYLTTLSHLRLVCSADGINFYEPEGYPPLLGTQPSETYGIEDCRVTQIADTYYLTYTAVSANGVGVGMKTTKDWKHFSDHGMILPPHNKDCAIFEEKINGYFYALHRPSSVAIGGNYIWLSSSPDGSHWGNHQCIVKTRPGLWDNARVGAGAAPIKTAKGWLQIYHGANHAHQYYLGAFLLHLENPSIVLARTIAPIMQPIAPYEQTGFFGHVVFTNGHLLQADGDTLMVYYGAADTYVCLAHFSIKAILAALV